jgi:hypothetical protein
MKAKNPQIISPAPPNKSNPMSISMCCSLQL